MLLSIDERIADIKKDGYWQEVRDLYLEKKCKNIDPNKNQGQFLLKQLKKYTTNIFIKIMS